jgi:hypothetical protein
LQLKLPILKPRGSGLPPWAQRVSEEADSFGTQKKLNRKATAWFSGVDTSPLGDTMGVVYNILPTDVPLYMIPSERTASLLTTPFEIYANGAFMLPQVLDLENADGELVAQSESTC